MTPPQGQPDRRFALRVGDAVLAVPPDRALVLGSDPGCGIRPSPLPPGLAPQHLRLTASGLRLRVEGVGSARMRVNGVEVLAAAVDAGDTVWALGPDGTELVAVQVGVFEATAPTSGAAGAGPSGAGAAGPGASAATTPTAPEDDALSPEAAAALIDQLAADLPGSETPAAAGSAAHSDSGGAAADGPVVVRFERLPRTISASARPLRDAGSADFSELMAEELRRAPWFTLSLVAHAIVLLILLWLAPDPPEKGNNNAVHNVIVDTRDYGDPAFDSSEHDTDIEVQEAPEPEIPLDDFEPEKPEPDPVVDEKRWLLEDPADRQVAWQQKLSTQRRVLGDPLKGSAANGLGEGFKQTIGELRVGGFEVMFVFDSTQSMSDAIDDTKAEIAHYMDVIRALVPDARVGLVTFRDRGKRELYVTRTVPLEHDVFRALNFVAGTDARDGGDIPEAVLDGLREALRQPWQPGSQRAVVLVGDAPPHSEDMIEIRRLVTDFTAIGNGRVHTVITASSSGRPNPDCVATFQKIARWGRGECILHLPKRKVDTLGSYPGRAQRDPALDKLPTSEDGRLLLSLLSLAIGREHTQDLAAVDRLVGRSRPPVTPETRRLATGEDKAALMKALARQPVDPGLIAELIRQRTPAATRTLVDTVTLRSTRPSARHAAAYCLQQVLELSEPPVDPVTGEPPPAVVRRDLIHLVRYKLGD